MAASVSWPAAEGSRQRALALAARALFALDNPASPQPRQRHHGGQGRRGRRPRRRWATPRRGASLTLPGELLWAFYLDIGERDDDDPARWRAHAVRHGHRSYQRATSVGIGGWRAVPLVPIFASSALARFGYAGSRYVMKVSLSPLGKICVTVTLVPLARHREEGMPMTVPGSPTVRRRRLAAELRGIRESKGKSGDTVAAALKWSPSKISRYELARTGLKPQEVGRLLDYYEITGSRRALLLSLAEDATRKGWWEELADVLSADYQQFIGLENEASSIAIWHVEVVTGLLQTEAYARHIISSYNQVEPIAPGMIERLVKVRMQRQQVLAREPGLQLSVVLDESILRRRIGDELVMYEQLQRLVYEADRPNVTLQILPLDAQHAVFGESFVIFRFGPDGDAMLQDVVSTEHLKNDFSVEGERETYLQRLAFQILVGASLDTASSRALILETAESHWSEVASRGVV